MGAVPCPPRNAWYFCSSRSTEESGSVQGKFPACGEAEPGNRALPLPISQGLSHPFPCQCYSSPVPPPARVIDGMCQGCCCSHREPHNRPHSGASRASCVCLTDNAPTELQEQLHRPPVMGTERKDQHLCVGTGGCRLCPSTTIASCSCSDGSRCLPCLPGLSPGTQDLSTLLCPHPGDL